MMNDTMKETDTPKIFWAGLKPTVPVTAHSVRLFSAEDDFREEATQHGVYAQVYLVEYDLAQYKQWPLILDEALRLFGYGTTGILKLKFSKTPLMSQFAFAAFLQRRKDFSFEMMQQQVDDEGLLHYEIRCQREDWTPSLDTFEFAMITDGRRPEAVARFVESVFALDDLGSTDWSIAICGPEEVALQLKAYRHERIRFVLQDERHTEKGWITYKKNQLLLSSTAENILVAHDRYELPADFLLKIRIFGHDFSVVVPAQVDEKGCRFPDWLATNSAWLCTVSAQLQYGDYSPHMYVNGGMIISKRRVLLETPWNNLLCWDQNEDIEHSRRLTEAGVTPRLARQIQTTVIQFRPGLLYNFVARLPFDPTRYVVAHQGTEPAQCESGVYHMGTPIDLSHQHAMVLAQKGVVVMQSDWFFEPQGLRSRSMQAEIAIDMGYYSSQSGILCLKGQGDIVGVSVNGVLFKKETLSLNDWSFDIDIASFLAARARFIVLAVKGQNVNLAQLCIEPKPSTWTYPLSQKNNNLASALGAGWGEVEDWGVWSIADQAHLKLSVPHHDHRVLQLKLLAFSTTKEKKWVGVALNGMPFKLLKVPSKKPKCFNIKIPKNFVQEARQIQLELKPMAPTIPSAVGVSKDTRKLGVGVIAIDVKSSRLRGLR